MAGKYGSAVSAVLLGVQGASMLLGAPAAAYAAPTSEVDSTALAEALAALDTAGMTDAERAAARAELWATYVSSGATVELEDAPTVAPPGAEATTEESAHPFEGRWNAADNGSVGAAEVGKALAELGDEAKADKLFEILDTFDKKLSKEGEAAMRGAIATTLIRDAAADGDLTLDEVKTVETTLQSQWGEKKTEAALARALPATLGTLKSDAAAYLLTQLGSVERHVGRFNMIVDEMLEGKNTVIDANGDGKLDVGDVVFTKDKNDKVTLAAVTKKLATEGTVAKAIVDASYEMDASGVQFELIKDHKANPDFWTVGSGGVLKLKPGVKASAAVRDMVENGEKYGFECATGLVATYYVAMLDILGPQDFDRVASDLRLGPWRMENDLDRVYITSRPDYLKGVKTDLKEDHKLQPGYYYYFKNWDVTADAKARGWQGENVIYLGNGKFYGHGIGLGDADTFVSKLASEMEEGGKTPSLLNLHAWISTKVLDMDLAPGQ